MEKFRLSLVLVVALAGALPAAAEHPVSGKPVPDLDFLEVPVQDYMDTNYLHAAVVGISHHGEIVYCRGFGWKDEDLTIPLQETATFRIASVTKTFTAAVIIDLVARGMLDLDAFAFDLGQPEGGILDLAPFPGPEPGDSRLADVKVLHLLHHTAGWDRLESGVPDWTGEELTIQNGMGLPELPTKEETMRWILGQPLQFDPGTKYEYSNIGYLALGLMVEQISGTDLLSYVRTRLLQDDLWFPATDLFMGRTFAEDQDPREPFYDNVIHATNVFDPSGPDVRKPYGSWNHELKDYYGRLVASAVPLLHQANHFVLNGEDRGQRITSLSHPANEHGGALPGSRTILYQGANGTDIVVMTNRYDTVLDNSAKEILNIVWEQLNSNNFAWPHELVDCSWIDFEHVGEELGSYDRPYNGMNDLGNIAAYTKVKFKQGTSSPWTGVVTRGHLLLEVEAGGPVVIGDPQ